MTDTANTQSPNVPEFNKDGDHTWVEIGGERMAEGQFRAARAGLAAGVASEQEHEQLRAVFAPRSIRALQKRAYENSAAHGFHETDQFLEQVIADLHDVVDQKTDSIVITGDNALTFLMRMKELRDAYRGNRLMLIAGEVTEAHEELRSGHAPDETYFPEQLEPVHEGDGVEFRTVRSKKPEGVPAELADIAIRVFDTAEAWHIDLEQEIIGKMDFNETRPPKHGRKF